MAGRGGMDGRGGTVERGKPWVQRSPESHWKSPRSAPPLPGWLRNPTRRGGRQGTASGRVAVAWLWLTWHRPRPEMRRREVAFFWDLVLVQPAVRKRRGDGSGCRIRGGAVARF